MTRKLTLISLVCLVLGIVLGGAPVANGGGITQSLLVGVKQDPGGGFTNADLKGRYWFRRLGLHNFETSDREAEITYGYIDCNGAGLGTGGFTAFNSDGGIDFHPLNGTYSVNTNGSFSTDVDTGHISSDRNFVIFSGGFIDDHGIHQGINAGVREPDTTLRLDSINGTWRFNDLELENFEGIDRVARACRGTLECNNGNWSLDSVGLESNGDKEIWTGSGTYSLNGNGFDFFEAGNPKVLFSAYTSGDGNILIFTAGFSGWGEIHQIMGVALKQTTKIFTNADLSGAYNCHMMRLCDFETDDREAEIIRGSIIFDGSGHWTFTGQVFHSDGSLLSGGTGFGTYSVNPDGSSTFIDTSDTPGTAFGNISADNNIIILNGDENVTDDWVSISGDITTQDGTPVCAMALANGQYMFSSNPRGKYNLSVPLNENGQVTLFAFADGFAPFKYIFTPEGGTTDIDVMMLRALPNSRQMTLTCQFDDTAENPGWAKISGQALAENGGTPLCAMVLANGQYTFSSAGNGEYELEVPLNENGQITLFGFADGFQPFKTVLDR